MLVFLNIVGHGMHSEYESDPTDMAPEPTAKKIAENRDVIVGIKTAHFGGVGWAAIRSAVQAGRLANVPVMVDDRIFTNSGRTCREKLLDQLRPGDIHTHTFNDRQLEVIDRFTGKVQPWSYQHFENRYVNVAENLREAMTQNPNLKVMFANGYYDLATPFFATEYTANHLGLVPALSDHVSLTYCEAGHMLYTKKSCLDGLHRSMADLYQKALPTP